MCCMRLAGSTGHKKSPFWHHCTTLSGYIFGTKACINNQKINLLNSNTSSTCPDNIVNFSLLMAEICWRVWGTPANFNGFASWQHYCMALLYCIVLQWASSKLCGIGRAAITFGIGPHSSFYVYFVQCRTCKMQLCVIKERLLCRYFESAAESSDPSVRHWWHKKLADFFEFCSNLQRKVEV